jgi:DNA-binding NarL/FixJ family response regulator
MTEITVMLVDDQDLLRAGMAMVIGAQPDLRVVGEAADGATAVERDAELAADVASSSGARTPASSSSPPSTSTSTPSAR